MEEGEAYLFVKLPSMLGGAYIYFRRIRFFNARYSVLSQLCSPALSVKIGVYHASRNTG